MEPSANGARAAGLSIGEVARLASVTPRTVRHYHTVGLLPEPERDASGYRRYSASDVIALVRITRLRALGMPIPQILPRVATGDGPAESLPDALRTLADELDTEIAKLADTRDQLRELAESETFDQPAKTLTHALRGHGLLGPYDQLRQGEQWAAGLLDALHPHGMSGVLDSASGMLADPDAMAPLLQRFRRLSKKSSPAEVESLAADVAAVLPRPEHSGPPVDIALMDKLLSDRLNGAQKRFLHLLRERVAQPAQLPPTRRGAGES